MQQKETTMLLCNYLFVKGYQLGIKTRNYDDCPILGGIGVVAWWITCILGGASLLTSHFFHITLMPRTNRYVYAVVLMVALTIFYAYKGRGHKLVERYEQKRHPFYPLNPYIVVPIAFLLSLGFLMFAGELYNS